MVIKAREATIPITEIERSAFCQTDEELKSKSLEEELKIEVQWQKLPISYLKMSPEELDSKIFEARREIGEDLVVLGHHYQRNEIIKFADFRGDSFKLSQLAALQRDAPYIVFCGVHFMAETADILSGPSQSVVLPNLTAGCSMSDMAQIDDVLDCWDDLKSVVANDITPITYMNSAASIKALCGRNEGIVCTSSNAPSAFQWAFERTNKVLFLPDQHLGRNTGVKLGIDTADMIVWNPFKPMGGHTEDAVRKAKIILWQGHCSVHTRFSVEQIEKARHKHPDVKVIVHPECTWDVVQAADESGSTEHIIKQVTNSEVGSKWAIGTELHLVNRLAEALGPDRQIMTLDPIGCLCSTMFRVSPNHLLWILESLVEGTVHNQIVVSDDEKRWTRVALDRMLEIH